MKKTKLIFLKTTVGDVEVEAEEIIPGLYLHKNPYKSKYAKKWKVSNQKGLNIFASNCKKEAIIEAIREQLSGLNWNITKPTKKHKEAVKRISFPIIIGE